MILLGAVIGVAGLGGAVYAQLADTQTASGSVNATTTSADLYICEPGATPGPGCGSDDNGADEAIFEGLENIRPDETVSWDIRLLNVGSVNLIITGVNPNIVETVDPGADCRDVPGDSALTLGVKPNGDDSLGGVFILGKNGDSINDNGAGAVKFRRETASDDRRSINIAPGDFEDVRLRLRLINSDAANCEGNEWDVSWVF